MPQLQCAECSFEWDADEREEPAPDHSRPTPPPTRGLTACPGSGEPGTCAACDGELEVDGDPCPACDPPIDSPCLD